MPGSSDLSFTRIRPPPPTVHLTSWPLRDESLRSALIFLVEVALAIIAAYATGQWTMGLLVLSLSAAATWTLWLPAKFELGPKGIVRSVLGLRRRVSWSEFAGYQTYSLGVFLVPHSQQPWSAVQGVYLPGQPPHTELLAAVEYYLRPRDADSNSGT